MRKLIIIVLCFLNFGLKAQEISKENLPDTIKINLGSAPIRKTPENAGEILMRVKYGTFARLIDIEDDHLKVSIDTTIGYVSYVFVERTGALKDYFDEYTARKKKIEEERRLREQQIKDSLYQVNLKIQDERLKANREARRAEMIKKYGQTNGDKVAKGIIWIGMTEEMLLDSWGRPEKINRTVTSNMVRKQYVYPSFQYVYVENGKVTAWQD